MIWLDVAQVWVMVRSGLGQGWSMVRLELVQCLVRVCLGLGQGSVRLGQGLGMVRLNLVQGWVKHGPFMWQGRYGWVSIWSVILVSRMDHVILHRELV